MKSALPWRKDIGRVASDVCTAANEAVSLPINFQAVYSNMREPENRVSQRFLNGPIASQVVFRAGRVSDIHRTCLDTRPHLDETAADFERKLKIFARGPQRLRCPLLLSAHRTERPSHTITP